MNKMYLIGVLKKSLLLLLAFLLVVSCSPAPMAPPACPAPAAPDSSTSTGSPQPSSVELHDQIVYVLDPRKFCDGDPKTKGGDLAGIRIKIPYLKSLGVTTVILGPVLNPQDFREVNPKLGTNEDLAQLIEAFHSAGITVILDLHLSVIGGAHPWFNDPRFLRPWNYENPKDNLGCAEPCEPMMRSGVAVDYDPQLKMPILDHTSAMVYPEVRDAIFSLVDTFEIDGIRYVTAHYYHSTFWPKFMGEFRAQYRATRPNFWHVADVFIWPGTEKSWQIPAAEFVNQTSSVGPIGMDGVYDWALVTFVQEVFAKGTDPNCIPFLCANLPQHLVDPEHPERLIISVDGFSSFHDAVENGNEIEKLYLASAFLMTINRVSAISSGNEYGIYYGAPGALFSKGLDQIFHENYKKLLEIRLDHAAFRRGNLTPVDPAESNANIISYARQYEDETFIVLLNNAPSGQSLTIDLGLSEISCNSIQNLLLENDQNIQLDDASLLVTLNAWEAKIIQCE